MMRIALLLTLLATVVLPVAFARYGDVWITGGGSSGRLEFQNQTGTWGTICDIGFSQRVGEVACRQLGYKHLDKVLYNQFGTTSRLPVVVCEIDCMGEENRLSECTITSCDTMYAFQAICTKENIVGIQCTNSPIKDFISGRVDDNDDNTAEVIDNEGSGDFDDEDFNLKQSQPTATPTPEIIVDYYYPEGYYSGGDNDGLSGGAIAGIMVSVVVAFSLVLLLVILIIALSYRKYRQHRTFIVTQRYPTIMVASCAVTTSKPATYAPTPTFGYASYAKGYKKVPITDYTPVSSTIGNSNK